LRRIFTFLHNSNDKSPPPSLFPALSFPLFEFGADDIGRGTFFSDKPDIRPNDDNNSGANISPKPTKTILNDGKPLDRDRGLLIISIKTTETYAGAGILRAGPRK
jgi:hypothetical protein